MEAVPIVVSVAAILISAASFMVSVLTWRRGRPRVRIRAYFEWCDERGGPQREFLTISVWNDGPQTESILDVGLLGRGGSKDPGWLSGTPLDLAPGQSQTMMRNVDNLAEDLHLAGVQSPKARLRVHRPPATDMLPYRSHAASPGRSLSAVPDPANRASLGVPKR